MLKPGFLSAFDNVGARDEERYGSRHLARPQIWYDPTANEAIENVIREEWAEKLKDVTP